MDGISTALRLVLQKDLSSRIECGGSTEDEVDDTYFPANIYAFFE
jgi:hypothetical protein